MTDRLTILCGDAVKKLREIPNESVQCCATSPPYWGLRDYKCKGQLGLEKTPDRYVAKLLAVFAEVHRALKKDGTLWVNLGDTYATGAGKVKECPGGGAQGFAFRDKYCGKHGAYGLPPMTQPNRLPIFGLKPKDLVGIPWMVAFALRAAGWYLRSDIIWAKPNPMPESTQDRPTKSHEYIFLLSKSRRYFYNAEAIAEPVSPSMLQQIEQGYDGHATKDFLGSGAQDASAVKSRILKNRQNWPAGWARGDEPHDALNFSAEIGRAPRLPAHFKGSLPGRSDGPGQERRSSKDRGREEQKLRTADRMGHSAGWRQNNPDGFYRNKRSVWTVTTQPYAEAHFATYPEDLIKPCILAGSRPNDIVLDPFAGSGTTGLVALELGRKAILIELNPEYIGLIEKRCDVTPGLALA